MVQCNKYSKSYIILHIYKVYLRNHQQQRRLSTNIRTPSEPLTTTCTPTFSRTLGLPHHAPQLEHEHLGTVLCRHGVAVHIHYTRTEYIHMHIHIYTYVRYLPTLSFTISFNYPNLHPPPSLPSASAKPPQNGLPKHHESRTQCLLIRPSPGTSIISSSFDLHLHRHRLRLWFHQANQPIHFRFPRVIDLHLPSTSYQIPHMPFPLPHYSPQPAQSAPRADITALEPRRHLMSAVCQSSDTSPSDWIIH